MMSSRRTAGIALVTGGSSGLGAALCVELASRGWAVVAASRRAIAPAAAPGAAGRIEAVELDVSRPASIARLAAQLDGAGRLPELLVNCAGININGVFEELSGGQARTIMDTNFHGVADTLRSFLPGMRERRRGTVLTIGSLAGLLAPPGEALYAASKHALEGLHESLHHELHGFGIRICLAEPGFVSTDLSRSAAKPAARIADYATWRHALHRHWEASIAGGMPAERVAREILDWAIDGKGLRRRFGADARWLPWLKALLPEPMYDAGIQRRFSR